MRKRILEILAIAVCIATFVSCGSSKTNTADQNSSTEAVEQAEGDDTDAEDVTGEENSGEDVSPDAQTEQPEADQPEEQTGDQAETNQPEEQTTETSSQEKELAPVPALKDVYDGLFEIGVCLNSMTAGSMYRDAVVGNFTSVTCENEMKPDSMLDQSASRAGVSDDPTFVAIQVSNCSSIIKFCEANNLKMRFHTLVWHEQTPEWFFHEDYSVTKPLVSKEVMTGRLKNYINRIIEYFDTEHPDLIYAIDVVNEAFNGNGTYGLKDQDNKWYDVMGSDYVYYAFLYAKEAIENSKNMKDCVLVYNDYGMMWKSSVVPNGLYKIFREHGADSHDYVDAIGMQSHLDTDTSIQSFLNAAKQYLEDGYELQITELDIGIPNIKRGDSVPEKELIKQGAKYRYLMEGLVDLKKQGYNVSGVTLWGINDAFSWRAYSNGLDAHALLWGQGMAEKPAVRGFALCDDIVSYYTCGIQF